MPFEKSNEAGAFFRGSFAWRSRQMEAAGDHEVEDQPEVALESDGDAFPDAPQFADLLFFGRLERRVDRAQQKRTGQTDALEGLPEDARFERFDVNRDVGQLGHFLNSVARRTARGQRPLQ